MRFTEGKIIGRFAVIRKGVPIEIVLRFPKKSDARPVLKFYNRAITETTGLSRIRPVTLTEERAWIAKAIETMKKKDAVFLFAVHNDRIIGSTDIERSNADAHQHVGVFGIALLKEYHGVGIGTRMTETVLRFARDLHIEIVRLNVYGDNVRAQRLYRTLGFVKAGEIPRETKRGNRYQSSIIMYTNFLQKKVRSKNTQKKVSSKKLLGKVSSKRHTTKHTLR